MPIIHHITPQVISEGEIEYLRFRYMNRPYEYESLKYLYSSDGQQAIADGIITIEQYLEIPCDERHYMTHLFSPDGRQAVADGIITLERYLRIPWNERHDMTYLFSPDGRQTMVEGIITLERYLKIPPCDRDSMRHLFSPDGRQTMAEGIITLEQYLRIPWNERDYITPLFSPNKRNDRQAITDKIITLEQYLEIPWHEQDSMQYLFSPDGRQAMAEGVITLERYLQIPYHDRESMQYLFSPDGRRAVADGIITIERYLQIPRHERQRMTHLFSPDGRQAMAEGIITIERYLRILPNLYDNIKHLFSSDGRQAVADGIITLERYQQIPWFERESMQYLFSPDGRRAVADDIITIERYLQIPSNERQNVMTALQDPNTQQRIINGQITIENIIGVRHHVHGVAVTAPNINGAQSTHTTSVHESASASATRLANNYKAMIDGASLESTIGKAQTYISRLSDDSQRNKAAKKCFLRLVESDYDFTDPSSQVSIRQLLALAFLAIHDTENRFGSLEDAEIQFVEALYEIQREYNLSKSGIDLGGQVDQYTCPAGTFNKIIEKLVGIHPDCQFLFIIGETASLKLPIVVREEAMRYFTTFANANTVEALTRLIAQVKKDGVGIIWNKIKDNITQRMFEEFGSLYRDITNPHFTALVEAGKDAELGGVLNTFQEQVQSGSYLNNHRYDDPEDQKGNVINSKTLIHTQIDLQLNKLENKAKNLRDRGHIIASSKATKIVDLLRVLNRDYFTDRKTDRTIDYETYKAKALNIIKQERSELDKHRGYKQILGNLLILIATLGTGQLLNKACTGKFLFFNSTDSSKKLDDLSNVIEKVIPNKN